MPDRFIQIRPPLAIRLYIVGFGILWTVSLSTNLVRSIGNGHASDAAGLLVMLAFGVGVSYLIGGAAVVTHGDDLLVRNTWRRRRIPREAIDDFRAGGVSGKPWGVEIYALLKDGSILPLDASRRYGPAILRRDRTGRAQRLVMLREWLRSERTGPQAGSP